jgi:hypothetical protein
MFKDSNDAILYNGVLFLIPCAALFSKDFIYSFYDFKEYMLDQFHSWIMAYLFLDEFSWLSFNLVFNYLLDFS